MNDNVVPPGQSIKVISGLNILTNNQVRSMDFSSSFDVVLILQSTGQLGIFHIDCHHYGTICIRATVIYPYDTFM